MSATSPAASGRARAATAARWRRLLAIVPLVLLSAALILRVLDTIPGWWRGEPRGVRRYSSVEALERETRTQLLLPFYFPDLLAWPPRRVYRAAGDGRPTSVVFVERATGRDRLVVAQCLDGDCAIPARLLPDGRVVQRTTVPLAGDTGDLLRYDDPNGAGWTDLAWRQNGRRVRLRMYGDDLELLRIARSMRRGHP